MDQYIKPLAARQLNDQSLILRKKHSNVGDCFSTLHGDIEQLLRSSRRNVSPVELIDGPFLMGHEYLTGALVERREIAKTSARSNGVLHHAPEAFDRIKMMPTMGR